MEILLERVRRYGVPSAGGQADFPESICPPVVPAPLGGGVAPAGPSELHRP